MQKLLKFSFVLSLLGIFILLILLNNINPPLTKINKINNNLLDKTIIIKADIISVKNLDEFQILTLKDSTNSIKAIANSKKDLFPENNTLITGKVLEYNNELEIQIEKIIRLEK